MQGFVKVKVKKSKNQNNVLLFKVMDSGVGIEPGKLSTLGLKAYDTCNQSGLNAKGIGLGLFICKKIIQQLGPNSNFVVKSEPHKKTQFSFEIYYKQEKEIALSFSKKFKEKGALIRLKSAPAVSGTLQFNKKKQEQQNINFDLKEEKNQQQIIENIDENFFNCTLQVQNNVNDEIDDIRQGLFVINSQKSEDEKLDFLPENFNCIPTRKVRSLSAEVQRLNESINDEDSEESNPFLNKKLIKTFHQIMILPQSDINEFNSQTSQEIQEIKAKPPCYFKEKNIPSKKIFSHKPSSRQQTKRLTTLNLNSTVQSPIAVLNILIVDDDPFNLLILSQYLEKLKKEYRVSIWKAYHGGQAVDIFSELNAETSINNLNYIILDCQMPIMDGYNASLLIKQKIEKENYINAVVIGHTAEVGQEVEEKLDGYILKPTSEKQFLEYLLSYL